MSAVTFYRCDICGDAACSHIGEEDAWLAHFCFEHSAAYTKANEKRRGTILAEIGRLPKAVMGKVSKPEQDEPCPNWHHDFSDCPACEICGVTADVVEQEMLALIHELVQEQVSLRNRLVDKDARLERLRDLNVHLHHRAQVAESEEARIRALALDMRKALTQYQDGDIICDVTALLGRAAKLGIEEVVEDE